MVTEGGAVRRLGKISGKTHWVKLRPRVVEFFEAVRPLYEVAIYTHGSREYAEAVQKVLEAEVPGLQFGKRVVSRDCCPDLRGEKSLARLFPGGASRALILDDRLDAGLRRLSPRASVGPRVLVAVSSPREARRSGLGARTRRPGCWSCSPTRSSPKPWLPAAQNSPTRTRN